MPGSQAAGEGLGRKNSRPFGEKTSCPSEKNGTACRGGGQILGPENGLIFFCQNALRSCFGDRKTGLFWGGRIFCEWCPETVTLLYQNAVLVWDRNTGPCSGPREGACPNLKWHGSNSSTYTSIPC